MQLVGVNKSENTGITSVDRSTKATLSTYNPWIQVSCLKKIYHFQREKLRLTRNFFKKLHRKHKSHYQDAHYQDVIILHTF